MAIRRRSLAGLEVTPQFWRGKRVFITGHTGFKGAWLSLWLASLGAKVSGYSLPAPTDPSLFAASALAGRIETSTIADVRDAAAVRAAVARQDPEIVFHLAAQALVRRSFTDPAETYSTNLVGTVVLLEALRTAARPRVVVVVTSDKCYADDDPQAVHSENDRLGGSSPYAASKACAEMAVAAFRGAGGDAKSAPALSTARAGNVIGGGDWAEDRLVPDFARAAAAGSAATLRHPGAVRPWQHVLDPLEGYLRLAERSWDDKALAGAWNFAPDPDKCATVRDVARQAGVALGVTVLEQRDDRVPEAQVLRVDPAKAQQRLGWRARLGVREAVDWTTDWYRRYLAGGDARALTLEQIERYQAVAGVQ